MHMRRKHGIHTEGGDDGEHPLPQRQVLGLVLAVRLGQPRLRLGCVVVIMVFACGMVVEHRLNRFPTHASNHFIDAHACVPQSRVAFSSRPSRSVFLASRSLASCVSSVQWMLNTQGGRWMVNQITCAQHTPPQHTKQST